MKHCLKSFIPRRTLWTFTFRLSKINELGARLALAFPRLIYRKIRIATEFIICLNISIFVSSHLLLRALPFPLPPLITPPRFTYTYILVRNLVYCDITVVLITFLNYSECTRIAYRRFIIFPLHVASMRQF